MEISEQFLKDLHNCECMPDVKKVLEKNFPEVFKKKWPNDPGQYRLIFIGNVSEYTGRPYITSRTNRETSLIGLDQNGNWMGEYKDPNLQNYVRPMRSGTVTIHVKDSKVVTTVVKED